MASVIDERERERERERESVCVCVAMVEWHWQGRTEVLRYKPVPLPLCPPQISHGLTWDWTRTSAVGDRLLSAWAKARPALYRDNNHNVKLHHQNKLKSHFLDFLSPSGKRLKFYSHKRPRVKSIFLCPYFDLCVFRVVLRINTDYFRK